MHARTMKGGPFAFSLAGKTAVPGPSTQRPRVRAAPGAAPQAWGMMTWKARPCTLRGPRVRRTTLTWRAGCVLADYGFEYSDDEPEEEDVDIENQYYNAKGALRGRQRCGTQLARAPPPARHAAAARALARVRLRAPQHVRHAPRRGARARRARAHARRAQAAAPAPGLLEGDDPKDALDGFAGVIQMEKEQGEWCATRGARAAPGPRRR
jgi:hypothetical protein